MDWMSWVQGLRWPMLDSLSPLLEQYYPAVLALIAGLALVWSRKRKTLLFAILLAFALTEVAKGFYAQPRPCQLDTSLIKAGCDADFGFPSGHASTIFALLPGILTASVFPVFLLFALFILFTRLYYGAHSLMQVAGGAALGLACFYAADWLLHRLGWGEDEKEITHRSPSNQSRAARGWSEDGRQLAHIFLGLFALALLLTFGRETAVLLLLLVVAGGLLLQNQFLRGRDPRLVQRLLDAFERPGVMVGSGAFYYALAVLLLATFPQAPAAGLALIAILAVGDGLSTMVGRRGSRKLPWNAKKTAEGLAAFIVGGGAVALAFVGWLPALLFAVILGVVETLPLGLDDNLTIGLAGCVLAAALPLLGVALV